MRKRAKVDATHGEIVDVLRKGGWAVLSLAPLGNGAPDLLVRKAGNENFNALFLVEVKTAKGKLREKQQTFHAFWPVHVLRSVDETITWMNKRRKAL